MSKAKSELCCTHPIKKQRASQRFSGFSRKETPSKMLSSLAALGGYSSQEVAAARAEPRFQRDLLVGTGPTGFYGHALDKRGCRHRLAVLSRRIGFRCRQGVSGLGNGWERGEVIEQPTMDKAIATAYPPKRHTRGGIIQEAPSVQRKNAAVGRSAAGLPVARWAEGKAERRAGQLAEHRAELTGHDSRTFPRLHGCKDLYACQPAPCAMIWAALARAIART
jgi:hypothetical protein